MSSNSEEHDPIFSHIEREPAGNIPRGLELTVLQQELIQLLADKAVKRLAEPIQLVSGEWSSEFIDGKEALAEWSDLELACKAIVGTVRNANHEFNAVGGLTLGANALAVGISAVSDCSWFFVRKEVKDRGTRRWIEGSNISEGDRILLVDDVVTTGSSTIRAYDLVQSTGAHIVAAATLVDRGNNATNEFAHRGVDYFPMATYDMLNISPVNPTI